MVDVLMSVFHPLRTLPKPATPEAQPAGGSAKMTSFLFTAMVAAALSQTASVD